MSRKPEPPSRGRSSGVILIVDDDEDTALLLAAVLGREGYEAHTLTKPLAAIDRAKALRPDLLILDFVMPEVLGTNLALALKNDSETAQIPILFVSGMTDDDHKIIAQWSGASAYLDKPWDEVVLLATVRRLVNEARDQA